MTDLPVKTPSPLARAVATHGSLVLLCVVALVQIGMVYAYDLTPWKGGGFGMFSTIDTTDARFVRLYVVVQGREIPAAPPMSLARHLVPVAALPTPARVQDLAQRLAGLPWVDARPNRASFPQSTSESGRSSNAAMTSDGASTTSGSDGPRSALPLANPLPPVMPRPLTEIHQARAIELGEPLPPPEFVLPIEALRVELWRYQFDSATNMLVARKLRDERGTP